MQVLENAKAIERKHGIKVRSMYEMAKLGIIPCYRVGPKRTGIRFVASEVLEALKDSTHKQVEKIEGMTTQTLSGI
jgi:hypothetical protein